MQRPAVMGIVNVTPDSFSDGGRFFGTEAAVAHGLRLAEAGADILDVGGESTRPGSPPVPAEEELARILPVLQGLRARTDVPLSVDTTNELQALAKQHRLTVNTLVQGAWALLLSRHSGDSDVVFGEVFRASLIPCGGQWFTRSDKAAYCVGGK